MKPIMAPVKVSQDNPNKTVLAKIYKKSSTIDSKIKVYVEPSKPNVTKQIASISVNDTQTHHIPKPPGISAPPVMDPLIQSFYETYKFTTETEIGSGTFGKVHAGVRQTDHLEVAVKVVPINQISHWTRDLLTKTHVPSEVALLRKCQPAERVIRLIDYIRTPSHAIIVMERPPQYQDLFDYITDNGCFTIDSARNIVHQIITTLTQCHSLGVIHRDLKQENVLIHTSTEEVKLIDFGLAQRIKHPNQTVGNFTGTAAYKPPEYFKNKTTCFADPITVWSIGCFAFSLLFGSSPFKNKKQILAGINKVQKSNTDTLPNDCRSFILECLQPEPESRPLLKNLETHSWLADHICSPRPQRPLEEHTPSVIN